MTRSTGVLYARTKHWWMMHYKQKSLKFNLNQPSPPNKIMVRDTGVMFNIVLRQAIFSGPFPAVFDAKQQLCCIRQIVLSSTGQIGTLLSHFKGQRKESFGPRL